MSDFREGSGGTKARAAVDIGGTFTDVVLEHGAKRVSAKVLTDKVAPEAGVLAGLRRVLHAADLSSRDIGLLVHGTTLATNAIIERKGAVTALVTTAGFRDSIEIAQENRFDQYDVFIEKPDPLVPRELRFTVPERIDAQGRVRLALDEKAVERLAEQIGGLGVESIAVGFLHTYANPAHERRTAEILSAKLPDVRITISSDVCAEMREYERFSTACANAYVQPLMARYLDGLRRGLDAEGFRCPVLLMTSGGGLTTLETAIRFPIRLVESGPAGGVVLANGIAQSFGLDRIVSFDMGGTTAKICLIDDGRPMLSRTFEVDRRYRFMKGSGLPVRIPVIEMVEIGAGGGSIAGVDAMQRVTVGPESAGSSPGPAAYQLGGTRPTVTDANVMLGRIDPENFAGGSIRLSPELASAAIERHVGTPLDLDAALAAFAVTEVVEENMANAARVHAVERGTEIEGRTLVAFGGGAPLHAARLAEKLAIRDIIIPSGAGVGSAIGFLRAPIAFEFARSRSMKLSSFDMAAANVLFDEMAAEAIAEVRLGAPEQEIAVRRAVDMRYIGQGHEILVRLADEPFGSNAVDVLRSRFEEAYRLLYARIVPGVDIEITGWLLRSEAPPSAGGGGATPRAVSAPHLGKPEPIGTRRVFDARQRVFTEVPVYHRFALGPGATVTGPALIVEEETTTVVTSAFVASIEPDGTIRLRAQGQPAAEVSP